MIAIGFWQQKLMFSDQYSNHELFYFGLLYLFWSGLNSRKSTGRCFWMGVTLWVRGLFLGPSLTREGQGLKSHRPKQTQESSVIMSGPCGGGERAQVQSQSGEESLRPSMDDRMFLWRIEFIGLDWERVSRYSGILDVLSGGLHVTAFPSGMLKSQWCAG